MRQLLLLICTAAILSSCSKTSPDVDADLPDARITDRVLADGFAHPWEITWGPDNKLWLTERAGKITQVDPATGTKVNVLTIADVRSVGEGGLLGMVFHPNFSANPFLYVVYNYDRSGTYAQKVVRYTVSGTTLSGPTVILDNIAAGNIHNGSRLLITPDLKLIISTGDAGNTSLPQSNASVNGKILRINLDGTIPTDNPIANSPIWSTGHRNPQGLALNNGRLYSAEHGASAEDEINIIQPGKNYGWPNIEGTCNTPGELGFCNTNAFTQPIFTWSPTIAPGDLAYYNSTLIPQWRNSLIVAILKGSKLIQLKLNEAGTQVIESKDFLSGTYGRLRDVCVAPDGRVFAITATGSDKIVVITGG